MFECNIKYNKNGKKIVKYKSLDGKRINWKKEFFELYQRYDYIVQRNMELADLVDTLKHKKDILLKRPNHYI